MKWFHAEAGSVILCMAAVCCTSCSAMDDLRVEVAEWLLNHSTTAADQAWERKLETKIKDKMDSNEALSGAEAAATQIAYDWCADRRKKFDEGNPNRPALTIDDKQQLCRMYAYFMKRGWAFPEDVRDDLTKTKFLLWIGK